MNAAEKLKLIDKLEHQLDDFDKKITPLLGIRHPENMLAFAAQVVDSIRRIEYVRVVSERRHRLSADRCNPSSGAFDPIQAAILLKDKDFEEACWLVFLATHCGKHLRTGWLLSRELYGGLGQRDWTWKDVTADPAEFRAWLQENHRKLKGKFGNHRRYESLKDGQRGTAAVIASYVKWVASYGSHAKMFDQALAVSKADPRKAFRFLYEEMDQVMGFGRLGRFDYLTMLAKTRLAGIEADSTYIGDSTGPIKGAKLLFDGAKGSATSAKVLEGQLALLDQHLGVGMQVLEDSLCNWQKSPNKYVQFRG